MTYPPIRSNNYLAGFASSVFKATCKLKVAMKHGGWSTIVTACRLVNIAKNRLGRFGSINGRLKHTVYAIFQNIILMIENIGSTN